MSRERRIITRAALRAEQYSNGGRVLRGTAAAFNQPTRLGEGWHEVIAPGAFTRSLQRQDDVRALVNHDPNLILGRTKSGTLKLSESARGLDFLVTLPDTATGRDTWTLVKRGDWDMCSFAFQVDGSDGDDWQDDWTCTDSDCCRKSTPLRTLRNLRLFDISPVVTYPAYVKGTSVSGFAVEDLSRDPDEDDDENGADGAGDPWTQCSGVIVSAEARARGRRAHRHTAAKEATDFAANLFRAQVRATKTLVGGQ